MSAALNSGISYWCDDVSVPEEEGYLGEYASEQISKGGTLLLYDGEGDSEYTLDIKKFMNGVKLFFEQGYDRYHSYSPYGFDVGKIDAEMADIIIQCALFGEVIYG